MSAQRVITLCNDERVRIGTRVDCRSGPVVTHERGKTSIIDGC